MEVRAAPQRGTMIHLYFPAALEQPGRPVPEPKKRVTPPSTATVLLVEDEDVVRLFTRRALETAGYR